MTYLLLYFKFFTAVVRTLYFSCFSACCTRIGRTGVKGQGAEKEGWKTAFHSCSESSLVLVLLTGYDQVSGTSVGYGVVVGAAACPEHFPPPTPPRQHQDVQFHPAPTLSPTLTLASGRHAPRAHALDRHPGPQDGGVEGCARRIFAELPAEERVPAEVCAYPVCLCIFEKRTSFSDPSFLLCVLSPEGRRTCARIVWLCHRQAS